MQVFFRLTVIVSLVATVNSCKRDVGGKSLNGLDFFDFSLLTDNNPEALTEDVYFSIGEDKITGRTTTYTNIDSLVPVFRTNADSVTVNGQLVKSGENSVDFTKPVHCKLYGKDGNTKQYDLILTNFTGLPIINIHTTGEQPITSKDNYLDATISINSNGAYPFIDEDIKIKGHGNSTWIEPKKPYKFKFDKKHSLLGMAEGNPGYCWTITLIPPPSEMNSVWCLAG